MLDLLGHGMSDESKRRHKLKNKFMRITLSHVTAKMMEVLPLNQLFASIYQWLYLPTLRLTATQHQVCMARRSLSLACQALGVLTTIAQTSAAGEAPLETQAVL